MSLTWLQEPSEEPFDINSVPREIKSQPLAEKKAPGKKQAGPVPSGPPSTIDAYEKLLSSIPEFSNFGKLFKVCILKFFLLSFLQYLFSSKKLKYLFFIFAIGSLQPLWSLQRQKLNMQLMLSSIFLIVMLCSSITAPILSQSNYWKM